MKRYPGLSPFDAKQKDIFFGRDNDIKNLSKLIFVERKILLYSKSGYGKTSLINAGVIPELENNKDFEFIKIRFRAYTKDSSSPSKTFLETLLQTADFKDINSKKTIINELTKEFKIDYWSIFKKNQLAGNKNKTYILIFDQFEELFTYPKVQIEEFKNQFETIIKTGKLPHFFEEIEDYIFENKNKLNKNDIELLYKSINIKALFSIRSDRMSELNKLADKIADIQKVFYELKPLDKQQTKQAIINPAKKQGNFESPEFEFEPRAINKIINALSNNGKQNIETTQLQIVCQRIENNIIEETQGSATLQRITENDIPNFKDIFLNFYNDAIAKVKTDTQAIVSKFVEDNLIAGKRRISLDELVCIKSVKKETLKSLVNTHLLRAERNSTSGISYELSHDTLVEPIQEVAEKRRKKEKLQREKEKAKKERVKLDKERKRQRTIIVIITVAAIISIAFAIFGFVQMKNTQKQIEIALKNEKTAIKNLENFNKEQAEKQLLNFKDLEKRAKIIIKVSGCPNEILIEMIEIAKKHPDSIDLQLQIKQIKNQLNKDCN
jgi:hypothetical protein